MKNKNYIIRELTPEEYPQLEEFLYQAIFVRPHEPPPSREVLKKPELQVYIRDFGQKPDDHAFAAVVEGQLAGVVWVRIMRDYGHVDDQTPSFAISLLPHWRGQGIGSELMRTMLRHLQKLGYPQASLAVQKDNYAVRMYRAAGFTIVDENEEEYIMVCRLNPSS